MGVKQSISGSLAKNMLIFWMLYSVCSESLPIRKFSESFMEELINITVVKPQTWTTNQPMVESMNV